MSPLVADTTPKLACDVFLVVSRSDRRTLICAASITLPRSPLSLSVGDEVPHIFTRKSRLQPGKNLITSTKRLLQHNLPEADSCTAAKPGLGNSKGCYSFVREGLRASAT